MASGQKGRLLLVAGVMAATIIGSYLLAEPSSGRKARVTTETAAALRTPSAQAELHPVEMSRPEGPPRIPSGKLDALGHEVTVACASCHANLQSNAAIARGEQLATFHQGLQFHHGDLRCVSCHAPPEYSGLRLADSRPVDFAQVQTLCAQCHAPQARDYEHGAHGGMTGYWDLKRGPRQRKGCIDCHDPHAPAFGAMVPTFKPYDRFLPRAEKGEGHD